MFTKFIEANGLVLEATLVPSRSDPISQDPNWEALHWSCTIKRASAPQGREAGPVVPIYYSMGIGCVQAWAKVFTKSFSTCKKRSKGVQGNI